MVGLNQARVLSKVMLVDLGLGTPILLLLLIVIMVAPTRGYYFRTGRDVAPTMGYGISLGSSTGASTDSTNESLASFTETG